jgi:hypothetical protein
MRAFSSTSLTSFANGGDRGANVLLLFRHFLKAPGFATERVQFVEDRVAACDFARLGGRHRLLCCVRDVTLDVLENRRFPFAVLLRKVAKGDAGNDPAQSRVAADGEAHRVFIAPSPSAV